MAKKDGLTVEMGVACLDPGLVEEGSPPFPVDGMSGDLSR